MFVEYNYIVPTLYSCRFLGVVRSRPQRHPSCLQNTTTLYRHFTAAGYWEWYDHGHDGTPHVCRIQLHCTDTLQLQVLGSGTITATTAPLMFVEYNYIVPTLYSCRLLGVVRSRTRRHPSCLQNTTTLYRHFTAAGSWEWYDHDHDGTPHVCRIQLHCTDTLQLQVLGSGTITATTAPLMFVEYNYIVPTLYSCRFLGVVRSRPRRHPSCLQNTATLYRHLTAAGSWEWYDHGHDGTPHVCRIQLHCTDTLQLQVLGSGMITATTAPLMFVEYNYIVPTLYSCRFLGVVRSRPRRHPSCLQNTTTLYRHFTAAGSWEWYDHGHDGTPHVCRIQLHCTDTLQLQVLGSGTITATTAPLMFVEYNYIVPTLYSCRFLGVVRSRPRRHPSCLQNTTTLYRHFTAAGSWEWYDHGHDGIPHVCRIQLHCTDTLQLQVLGSGTITATTAPLMFVEYNYIVPTHYSCRFLGVVRSRPRRYPSCLQNTTTLYRHFTAAGSWEWYDHGHDGTPHVCRIQLHCTDTLQLQVLGSGTITATTAPLMFVEYNYIVPTLYSCRFLGVVRSRPRRYPSCLQNTTTLYRHFTAAGSWEWYDHGHNGTPHVCRIQLHCTDTLQLQVIGSGTITATTAPLMFVEYNYIVPTLYSCRFLGVVRSRPRRHPSCLQNTTTLYRHFTAAGCWEWYDHGHDGTPHVCRIQLHCTDTLQLQVLGSGTITTTTVPLMFVEYNYIVLTLYSCRFLGVVRSRPRRHPSRLQNTTTLYRHFTAAGSWEWYDHGHDGTPHVCRIQLHCTDTLQLQVLGSGTITATTAPLMFVEYNYIVPTLYSCRFLGVVRSRPRRHPSCLQNTTTLYRHFTAAGSWEWYDHGHDGIPHVCRIQLHCTDTLQLQVLGSGTITATTAPLMFVEYNYIVPTHYSCRFLGVVRSRPRRYPSCLQNTTTLYRHFTAAGSWEWYDHGHDGTPHVCRIQLHCTDTLQLQVLGSGTITATTAPLMFVEYNYIVPTLYSCRLLGVVRSRPRRHPSCLQNTTTLYRHITAAGSWEWYDHDHDGTPHVCRIQLHCTDTLQLQVLGSGTITATTAPLMFVEYNYIVPTLYSCRFLGVVRSRPRRHPSCLQNTATLYRHLTAAGSWEWYDHGHDGTPHVCRIQLHCTDTLQLQVLGSGMITATTAPLMFVEYNYIVPTLYSCRFLGVVRSRPRRHPSCLQNTTTLYRHFTAAGSWEWYDHGHDGTPHVCRIQLHCTDTLQLQVLGSGTITATTAPLMFVEYNYIVPTLYSCRFLGVVRSRPRRHPSCLQNTTTLYRHFTAAGSWEWYDHGHDGIPHVCRIQLHCTDTLQLQVLGSGTITATTAPLMFVEYNYIVPTHYSCRFLGVVRSRPQRHPSCLQNTTTLYRHFTAAGSWEWYDHGHDGTPHVCRIQLHCTDTLQLQVLGSGTITATTAPLMFVEYSYIVPTLYSCRFLGVVRSRPRRYPSCLQNTTTLYRHFTAAGSWEWYDHGHNGTPHVCRIQLHCTDTLQLQVIGSGTITATTAPLMFVEYNYIVPTLYSCRFLGVVRSRPRRHPSCLQNTTTLYRHFTAAGCWEWYDHGHDGTPHVCRIQLHCTDTLQLQVLGSGTITTTTVPLMFVEYNYIVLTLYSCRFLGVVRSRPRRHPSRLQNTTTLYRHFTAAGSWEWYDHGHDGTPHVCRIQLHCTDTLQLQVLGSGTITATTAPLMFVEYNYIVPTLYSCRFLGVVRSRPRRHPSCLQNTTTLYRHFTAAGSWEWYDHGHDGIPHVCRIQLHCTDTLQLQVLGSGTITATTAPLMFVEYNYIVPTHYSCRFLGVVRSRPRRYPSCLQNTTTLYRHFTAAGSWEWYDHGHDGTPHVCRIQLHSTDTLQLQVLGSGTITATTAPLMFVEYNYIVPTPYSCRFLGVV